MAGAASAEGVFSRRIVAVRWGPLSICQVSFAISGVVGFGVAHLRVHRFLMVVRAARVLIGSYLCLTLTGRWEVDSVSTVCTCGVSIVISLGLAWFGATR